MHKHMIEKNVDLIRHPTTIHLFYWHLIGKLEYVQHKYAHMQQNLASIQASVVIVHCRFLGYVRISRSCLYIACMGH